jgi:hypothetical protein
MADLVGAIEKLKKLLEDRSKRVGRATNTNPAPNPDIEATSNSIIYTPPSAWMKSLEYFPMAKAQSGSVVMRARGPNIGYIYPRVGKATFNKWVANNWRGGFIYWYGSPSLKDYSIIARKARPFRRGGSGRLGIVAVRNRKVRGTMYNAIPKNVRDRGRASARISKKNNWRL